jgi:hypothetical protein
MSIPGIGWIVASQLLARIGNWRELKNIRQLAGFLGLAPTENSTGERTEEIEYLSVRPETGRRAPREFSHIVMRREFLTKLKFDTPAILILLARLQFLQRLTGK